MSSDNTNQIVRDITDTLIEMTCEECGHKANRPIGRFCWNCQPMGSTKNNYCPDGYLATWHEKSV